MPEEYQEQTAQEPEEKKINVHDWVKKFAASEKIMKSDFLPKWKLARKRQRSEYSVKRRNSEKMTHENVNLVYSIGQSFVSSVYFKSPNCNLTAREEVNHANVENTEIKVNDWLKDKKIKQAVKRIIWDAYSGGFGARFIDYEYDDIEDPNNVLAPAQVDPLTGAEIAPPRRGRIVLKNDITFQRIRPDLVRFPKGFDFDNYQDSPWIGFDVIMPIEEVQNNENWDQEARIKIQGEKFDSLSENDSKTSSGGDGDDLYSKISFVFIKPASALEPFKLLVFCHKYPEKELQMIPFDKGHVGYPIKFIYFNPLDDDCSYPNGDPWNFESMSAAVDTWWQKMSKHVERSNPKTIYDSTAVSKPEIQNIKSNNDLEFVGIQNKDRRNLQELFKDTERPAVHPDVSRFYEVARQLLSEISPRSGMARGAVDNKVDTATEAKIMQTGEIIDVEARIDVVGEFIKDIVLDVAGILEKSLQMEVPISKPILDPLTGQETGDEQVVKVGREGFTSKINVDVDVESMQAQNKDVLFRQLIDFLQLLVKFEPIMNKTRKTIDPAFWLERIMETRNIRNIEKGIIDLPPAPPVMIGPDGKPVIGAPQAPGMPPETISDGVGQEVMDDAMAGQV